MKFRMTSVLTANLMANVNHGAGSAMDQEFFFWDNARFMKQLGIAQ